LALQVQVHAAIWVDGKLVVHRSTRHGRDRVTLPGGRIKPRESIHDGLRREVQEEVRLDVEVGELLFAGEVLNLSLQDVILIFNATILGAIDARELDLVAPDSPDARRILPPVVTALTTTQAASAGQPRWLGNLAVADSGDR
jgi:ADP-ribose pyrophosphatase YjhB (NUDIX family)